MVFRRNICTIPCKVKKTGRILVAYNGPKSNGAGTEIVARIAEKAIKYLNAPIMRVAEKDSPIPFAPILERDILPQEEDVAKVIEELIDY